MIERIIKTFFNNEKKKPVTVMRTQNQTTSKNIKRIASGIDRIKSIYNFDEREEFFKRVFLLEER